MASVVAASDVPGAPEMLTRTLRSWIEGTSLDWTRAPPPRLTTAITAITISATGRPASLPSIPR